MEFQRWLYKLPLRLRSLFRRRRVEQELDEELQFHLDRQIDDLVSNGMDPREARYAALRAMHGIDRQKEAIRDVRGTSLIDNFVQDLRYAFRTLRRSRGFTAVAIGTLTIGIGGITTIFSVVNGVLLRPLPYEDADRLISIAEIRRSQDTRRPFVPPPRGADWMDRPEITALLAGWTWLETWRFEAPERTESPIVPGARVPPNFFSTIGATPEFGRDFKPDDVAGPEPAVAIVSYPFWQRWLAADPNVIGKPLLFAGGSLIVIGVMPPAFRSPFVSEAQLWALLPQDYGMRSIMIGRMKPGVSSQAAQDGINSLIKRMSLEYPSSADRQVNVGQLVRADSFYQNLLLLLFASVALILLMAVINVGNLMLSRSLTRGREIAIRSALGAGRHRLIRQLLTESLLLAVPGGLLGLAIARAGVNLIILGLPSNFPRLHEIYLDTTVMVFALGATLVASLAFGVFPAFAFARIDLQDSLKNGAPAASQGRRSLVLRQTLIATEIGLAAILLIIGITPGYFRTLRLGFAAGSPLSADEQSAVINEKMAREFWPNSDPIGSRIKPGPQNSPWLTIVGVVHDEKLTQGFKDYSLIYRSCGLCGSLIVKTRSGSTDVAAMIRREVAALDNTTLISSIQTADEIAAQASVVIGSRFQMALFLAFAGAGLLLSLAGVYGVTSYSAGQRTQEVGIRLALGATRFNLLWTMMRQSMVPIVLGIASGVALASALTGFLQTYLFEVKPLDTSIFVAVPVFLAIVAIIANFIPLRRGTRVDPVIALRHE